jgi:tRNA A-37 threonylcarbamoyl transferase component Bud32/tetratricopeptide (TPR) repeat protein
MPDAAQWSRLSEALDRLLDLDPVECERELESIARDEPEFAAELRELLAAADHEGVLERGIAQAAPALLNTLAESEGTAEEDLTGQRIGSWRVLRRIGRGGMGEVLLAERDGAEFVQQAAVKRLKRGVDSDELLRRFAQERRILASLEHPLIARLLDGGVDDEGRPFFAMEYVPGVPITQYAREARLDARSRVQLMLKVCEAVAYAQRRLIVHRDLKPSNLIVDPRGEPRLLDFGIAKLLDEDAGATRTGQRVLSPAYAAPEQILGEPVGTSTDVYALGVLLYELLSGRLPHPRRGDGSDGFVASLTEEVSDAPSLALRRASADRIERAYGARGAESGRLARAIDGDLDRIVLTALRREPERRYASAEALAGDLRAWLDGRPIAARRDTAGYRLRKFVRRNKVGVATGALALVSLLAGLAAALWQAELARLHAAEAEQQRARATEVKEFVVTLFQTANPAHARKGAEMLAVDLVRDAATRIERELGDVPYEQAELRVAIGGALATMGLAAEGLTMIEASIAQLRGLSSRPDTALAEALHQAAIHYVENGRLGDAELAVDEALKLLAPAGPDTLPRIAVRTTRAKIVTLRGDLAAAEDEYRMILGERRAVVGPDDPRLAVDWNNLAAVALRRDRYADAQRAYAESTRLIALDPEAPESRQAWLRLGLGMALVGRGDFGAAERELELARAIAERTLHAGHPIVANIAIAAARLARYQGRPDLAMERAARARAIYAELQHPDGAAAALQLGLALRAAGRHSEAEATLNEAVQGYDASASRAPESRLARAALGLVRVERGDGDGLDAIQDALATLQADGLERSNAHAEALGLRAQAAAHAGDATGAEAWRRREIDALIALFGTEHPRVLAATAACTPAATDCLRTRP